MEDGFQKLTPTRKVTLEIYGDALNYAFSDTDIKNIAISGAYGSGKSSIIESFKYNHPGIQFLHISLARFEVEQDTSKEKGVAQESAIEGKILNQLIHQIDPNKIPLTNFKVKHELPTWRVFITSLVSLFFIVDVVYLFGFGRWTKFISSHGKEWLGQSLLWSTSTNSLAVGWSLCIVILGRILYMTIKMGKNRNIFKRVNLQGNEIEVFEQNDESDYFDKHLNEVLYLFRKSGAKAIVFEDVDRYNTSHIFGRLRELNTLINAQPSGNSNSVIRFFYLLRDDVFVSKDRTKFFDFIIPVVPVLDSTNSYDQFLDHFKRMLGRFDQDFLERLSLYVDDMRLLKNIYNEFVIYHDRIQSKDLRYDKLLALLTYKNVFPRDFSELQLRKGFVHTLFQSKQGLIMTYVSSIDAEIQKIKEAIRRTESEFLTNLDELDAVYLVPAISGTYLDINGKSESDFKTRAEFIHEMKSGKGQVRSVRVNGQAYQTNIQGELDKLLTDTTYVQRKQSIEGKTNEWVTAQTNNIAKLKKKKLSLQSSRLQDLISKENIDTFFRMNFTNEVGQVEEFKDIKSNHYFPLIKYLIRNGYIDESYPDYMSYFYPNSLQLSDKNFLLSVADQVPREYTYSLNNPELVVSKLHITDFNHEEVLNFDLLNYLLSEDKHLDYLEQLILQIKNTKNYDFVLRFLETDLEHGKFIEKTNAVWSEMATELLNESSVALQHKLLYVVDTLYYSSERDIEAMNIGSCLSVFISNQPSFLYTSEPNIQKLIDGFRLLNVKFTRIEFDRSNKILFDDIYRHDLYAITAETIFLILEKVYLLPQSSDYVHKNFSLIVSKPNEPLTTYIKKNMDEYVRVVLENCNKLITDDEKSALTILNDSAIEIDNRKMYLSFLKTMVEFIKNVEERNLWVMLLAKDLVQYNEDNILSCFFENGMDPTLVAFINSGHAELAFDSDSIDMEYVEGSASKFFNAVVTTDTLDSSRYTALLRGLGREYNKFSHKGIKTDKVMILIKLGVIKMTEDNLLFIRNNYPDQIISFIVENLERYTELVSGRETYDSRETLMLLDQHIPDEFKITLIDLIPYGISIKGKGFSDEVKLHVLQNKLNSNDIPFLLETFPKHNKIIKNEIKHLTITHVDEIWENKYPLAEELFSALISSSELDIENRKRLFALCLPAMKMTKVIKYLDAFHMDDFSSVFDGKRPKFEDNPVNEFILTTFREKGWITNFESDGHQIRAIGRNLRRRETTVG